MTVLDAAESVLATTGTPLGYREIADGILKTRCGRRQARHPKLPSMQRSRPCSAATACSDRARLCRRMLWISESAYPPLTPR